MQTYLGVDFCQEVFDILQKVWYNGYRYINRRKIKYGCILRYNFR